MTNTLQINISCEELSVELKGANLKVWLIGKSFQTSAEVKDRSQVTAAQRTINNMGEDKTQMYLCFLVPSPLPPYIQLINKLFLYDATKLSQDCKCLISTSFNKHPQMPYENIYTEYRPPSSNRRKA